MRELLRARMLEAKHRLLVEGVYPEGAKDRLLAACDDLETVVQMR